MRDAHFLPEGCAGGSRQSLTLAQVREQLERGEILEGEATRCDERRTLHVNYRGFRALIPREEAVSPLISGADREIALLSRVGRPVSFVITSISVDGGGRPLLMLSRRQAQERALDFLMEHCVPGSVIRGRVTHLERFGAFVDVGCGVVALLPLDRFSVSRVDHPCRRVSPGQDLLAMVSALDREQKRLTLSTRELLGSWLENASRFAPGETVTGVVRGIQDYGAFVELAPNLSGLAEPRAGLRENDRVSVFIKSIRPETMKIKLQIIENLGPEREPSPLSYQITDGPLLRWRYGSEERPLSSWDAEAAIPAPL